MLKSSRKWLKYSIFVRLFSTAGDSLFQQKCRRFPLYIAISKRFFRIIPQNMPLPFFVKIQEPPPKAACFRQLGSGPFQILKKEQLFTFVSFKQHDRILQTLIPHPLSSHYTGTAEYVSLIVSFQSLAVCPRPCKNTVFIVPLVLFHLL